MPAPYIIAIDPGHGGSVTSDPSQLWDPGVVAGSVMEKDITLDVARRLRALLQREKVKVVLTRTSDQYVEISERWNRVHASGAQLFVSLHVNAFEGNSTINGETIFYPKPDSLSFAQAIDAGLAKSLHGYQIADDGVAQKPELWIHSDIPTATIEPVYLTNPREASLLRQAGFRDAIAAGVYQGLLAYDPQIEATRTQIVGAEAAAAAQRAAQSATAANSVRTSAATRWAVLIGAIIGLWMLMRLATRRPQRSPQYPRRPVRRRRQASRRF
ncbi:MAG TPA: N-acetylmuramoyl-L-alanine amidase [Candidatus Dormibacteraeota bacterium]|jgi:N-acetylmuramoyl-L-alanine amidase